MGGDFVLFVQSVLCIFPLGYYLLVLYLDDQLYAIDLQAQEIFRKCISVQEEWKQFHHLCYWELMWINIFQQNWMKAYYYSDLLCKESRWSKVKCSAFINVIYLLNRTQDLLGLFVQQDDVSMIFSTQISVKGGNTHLVPLVYNYCPWHCFKAIQSPFQQRLHF